MQPVPIVYGMTIAEYAFMIAGEKWLSPAANARYEFYKTANNSADTPFHFLAIKCRNYTHATRYSLPVRASVSFNNFSPASAVPRKPCSGPKITRMSTPSFRNVSTRRRKPCTS